MPERVSVTRCSGGTLSEVRPAVRAALGLLESPLAPIGPASVVLIKPNVCDAKIPWRSGVMTNPNVVQALVELVQERQPAEVLIAEASPVGMNTKDGFAALGYPEIARQTGARLVDLNDGAFTDVALPQGSLHKTIAISEAVRKADFLINVPVAKTHVATGISVCMKNLKGTMSATQKKRFHFCGLTRSIVELNSIVRPQLNVVDASIASEGDGPLANTPMNFGVIAAGFDARATDVVMAKLMGFETDELEYLRLAAERWGRLTVDDLEVVGEPVARVAKPFRRAAASLANWPGIECVDGKACSGCAGALQLALSRARDAGILDRLKPLRFVIGPEAKVPIHGQAGERRAGEPYTIYIGKCQSAARGRGNFVPGCPPQVFLITDELREMAGLPRLAGEKGGFIFDDEEES